MFIKLLFLFVTAIAQREAFNNVDNEAVPSNQITVTDVIKLRAMQHDIRSLAEQLNNQNGELVKIQLYYECLCPDCRDFDSKQFKDTVVKLASHLDIYLYPYGNAKTVEKDGKIQFICQHGPAECYGNKLHACAIDYLKNVTAAVFYNSCMMDYSQAGEGSDDAAADVCARSMNINSDPIKECAKGDKGTQLLKYYGEESKKAKINDVPYILINGVKNDGDQFMQDVCSEFQFRPSVCNALKSLS